MRSARYKTVRIELRKNNTVYAIPELDDLYNADDLLAILGFMKEVANGERFRVLMLLGKTEFLMTKEARDLFKTDPTAKELIIAEAIVINSRSSRILYNLLTKIYAPPFPFKAFKHEKAANEWQNSIN